MKLQFWEGKFGAEIKLTPETIEESSQLLRFTNNAKMEKPEIYFSFSGEQYCSIWIKKVAEKNQENSIRP